MNNLIQRIVTAIILAVFIFSLVSLGGLGFILLIMTINFLGLFEFYRLFDSQMLSPRRITGTIFSSIILGTSLLTTMGISTKFVLLANIPAAFIIFIAELYLKAKDPFLNIAITFLGVISITIPLCFFFCTAYLPLRSGTYHKEIILGIFYILWASDSGAYFIGKFLGKRPLFKRISPNKTWEGSIGGGLFAICVAFFISKFYSFYNTTDWLLIALIVVVAGPFGDLVKSMMKRSLGLKDSGTILPGHGGIIDRFDTLLSSCPFICSYLILSRNV
ncbi:MAG: phosphatidate cytidylyltransferase [Chitinophagales bacterium]